MSKRYRFLIILAALGICFAFLYPTIRWYFLVPKEDQALALGTREQIKSYSMRKAQFELTQLVDLAKDREAPLPADFNFLKKNARANYKLIGLKAPKNWTAHSVLQAFATEKEALEAIESKYRREVLKLKDVHTSAIQLGLDLSGGMSVIIQANLDSIKARLGRDLGSQDKEAALDQALEVLNSRIDKFGLSEPVIRRQGDDQIYIEIPGAADPERINSIIMGKGRLAFHIEEEEASAKFNSYYAQHPMDTFDGEGNLLDPSIIAQGNWLVGVYDKDRYGIDEFVGYTVIREEVGLDGNHIQSAMVDRDQMSGQPMVTFVLDSEGGELFYKLTSANVGRRMCIVMDDKVKSRATIREAIRERVQLSGFGYDEAKNIETVLKTAALPVELEPISQQSIGASSGADTIKRGLNALLGGIALVMVFLLIYYKGAGINAVVAQVLNLFIMLSVLSAFSLTLTLPSIAGFILTIGMAVDANVIIFERIKEELRLGKDRKSAVEAGFAKAFWAIMDGNITTFIAAMFLSQLGTGPIQGFAVSLAIGVVSSVFTALFVSRLIFDFGTEVLGQKKLSISWRIK